MVANSIIDADEFVSALKRGDAATIEHKRVRGAVQCRGDKIGFPVRALYVYFEGEVDFADTAFDGGADFSGCTFEQTFSLHNATVAGDLELNDVVIFYRPSLWGKYLPDAVALDLTGAEIEGNLIAERAMISGAVDATGLKINGNARIAGCEIDSGVTFDNARFFGDFEFGAWVVREPEPHLSDIYRAGLIIGNINAINIYVHGKFDLLGLQVYGNVTCWGSVFESSVFAGPLVVKERSEPKEEKTEIKVVAHTVVHGDLNFAAARIAGYLQLLSMQVGGLVNLLSVEAGTVRLGFQEKPSPSKTGPCIVGGILLYNARIHGDVGLPLLIVTGADRTLGSPGVFIKGATIEGSVRFWSDLLFDEKEATGTSDVDYLSEGACISGHLMITQSTIKGDCDLQNVAVTGGIRFNDSTVKGDILFRSRASLLTSQSTLRVPPKRLANTGAKLRRACAASLDLTMAHCENDVDLTGLDLIAMPSGSDGARELLEGTKVGCVVARALQVQGEVRLFAYSKEFRCSDSAGIPGAADFRNLRAFRFVVSHNSFDADAAKVDDVDRIGLSLASAEIGELRVETNTFPRSWWERLRGKPAERFPRPLDLQNLAVRDWGIGESTRAEKFKALLSCDPVFRRDTYVRVEHALRNGGHEADANVIYRAAQRRARRQVWKDIWRNSGWVKRLWRVPFAALYELLVHAPFAFALGYGTSPLRLLAIIGLVWAGMMPVYYTRENFEPSLAYREVRASEELPPIKEPPADLWRDTTPFFASLRYHMPIVGLLSREEWKLADGRGLYISCEEEKNPEPPKPETSARLCQPLDTLTPEDLGLMISLLNWALWPLVLTFSIRKMLR